jgi:hypothetical protein
MAPSAISWKDPVRASGFGSAGVKGKVLTPQQRLASRTTTGSRILCPPFFDAAQFPIRPMKKEKAGLPPTRGGFAS